MIIRYNYCNFIAKGDFSMTSWFAKQNLFFKLIIIYIACGIVAYLSLCLVCLIPIDQIQTNVSSSISQIKSEGLSYHVTPYETSNLYSFFCNYKSTQLDNFVDSEMLLIASHDSERKFFQTALLGEHYEVDGVPFYALTGEGNAYYAFYPRYWHGYLLYLKPLLFFTNYINIRVIICIIETLLLIITIIFLIKNKLFALIIPLIAMWTFLGPIAMSKSMQYFDIYFITMVEILIIICKQRNYSTNRINWIIHFFIAGCATSFFDFLTYPLVTFAIPFALLVFIYCKDFGDSFFEAIKTGIAWSSGYLLFWAGKWIGGSLILKTNILADAFTSIALRTGTSVYDEKITYLTVLSRNLSAKPGQLVLAVLASIVAIIIFASKNHGNTLSALKSCSKMYMLLLISLTPFAWYFVTQNHSGEHFFFTFRELSITVFSLWLFACSFFHTLLGKNTV